MRKEEKILLDCDFDNKAKIVHVDTRKIMSGKNEYSDIDIIIDREVSHTLSLYALKYFESINKKTINNHKIASTCGDKIYTSLLLEKK